MTSMSTNTCKTVKVKPWGKGQGDFVEINVGDYDSSKYELWVDPALKPATPVVPPAPRPAAPPAPPAAPKS